MIPKQKKPPLPPAARLVGMRLVSYKRGTASCTLKTGKRHANTMDSVHGGILCALADAAMGYAFMSLIPKDMKGATVEFKINFLLPVFCGDTIRAQGKVLAHGRSLFYAECALRNSKGRLAAKASCTCKLTGPRITAFNRAKHPLLKQDKS